MVRSLADFIATAVAFVLAITVHEFAHAFVADRLGDPTPRRERRVTLNPLAHLDPLGTILIFVAGFGWGRPVNVNPRYLPWGFRGMALVAAAGPLSNLALAWLFALPLRAGDVAFQFPDRSVFLPSVGELYITIVFINILLAVFNLIPLAPLDGAKVVQGLLPYPYDVQFARLQQYGPLLLLALIFIVPFFLRVDVLGMLIRPPIRLLFQWMVGA
ncbi:MAG: site-2 protease family protein [Ardenticatenia bacterium]|nr:site-2 protease family protein [Ardenticatenia bacterium]